MSTTLPITFQLADFPVGFQGDANQFGQQLFRNVTAYTQSQVLTGSIEGTQPSNDQGPWLHNRQWYFYDANSGVYLPEFTRGELPTQNEGPILQDNQWMFWDALASKYTGYVPSAMRSRNVLVNGEPRIAQRGSAWTNVADNTYVCDRWRYDRSSGFTGQALAQQNINTPVPSSSFNVQSSFSISFSSTTVQAVQGANDFAALTQRVERVAGLGLMDQPSSLSLWLFSSSPGTYGASLRNADFTQSLVMECKITRANAWTRFAFPNLAQMPTSQGDWGTSVHDYAYQFTLALACGGTYQVAPEVTGIWQPANRIATTNQTNFFAANGNFLAVSLVQHEPGSVCTPFENASHEEVLLRCMRYYQKTCPNDVYPANAVNPNPGLLGYFTNATFAVMTSRLPVPMRTTPGTAFFTNPTSGAVNSFNTTAGTFTGSSAPGLTVWGFSHVTVPSSTNVRGNVMTADAFYDAEVT
jgi:hypothetical protein